MRKILLLTVLLISTFISNAQLVDEKDRSVTEQLVRANKDALGLSSDQLNNLIIQTAYQVPNSDIRMAYLQQSYLDIPVYNQVLVLAFKNGRLVSKAGEIIQSMEERVGKHNGAPSIPADVAVRTALINKEVPFSGTVPSSVKSKFGNKLDFGNMSISHENITAELLWFQDENGKETRLAWQIFVAPKNSSDYWLVRVDAETNTVLSNYNLTVYCNWEKEGHSIDEHISKKHFNPANEVNYVMQLDQETKKWQYRPFVVNNATYRVVKYPAESPIAPGGAPSLHTNPWTWAPGNATSLGWHSDGVNFYDSTRGNNVFAYEDQTLPQDNVGLSAKSTTAQPDLSFDFAPNFAVAPTQRTPAPNQQFNTTNLFYWNNLMHDVSYLYGFTEAARNFQVNNQGRGGNGNDPVLAEAQDVGGIDNANFATPADGGSGRMQMYLWSFGGSSPQKDGDADNSVVAHEYTHGISNRLTGNGFTCLGNAEQMGEGWSDYYSLMVTTNWAIATPTDGFNIPRPIGLYALNNAALFAAPGNPGIRHYPYSTNMAVNPVVYTASLPTSAHDRGEIWCSTLWDMTWAIIQSAGINANLFNVTPTITGGNNIAFKLVTEGMRLQSCSPGFIDGRNAILKADTLFFGAQYSCTIIKAFARRGLGVGASQGLSTSVTDQVPSFLGATPSLTLTSNFPQRQELQNIVYTNTLTTYCDPVSNYLITDTLPLHVTYVSGGTYDALNRVVSFGPINQAIYSTQNFQFTVTVNAGSYFPPSALINENVDAVVAPAIPVGWAATTTNATAFWRSSTTSVRSAPNSFFANNIALVSDVRLTSSAIIPAIPLEGFKTLSFWHRFVTENTFDGGVIEISTNGGTSWTDLEPFITLGGYNGTISGAFGSPIAGRRAFTGNSGAAFTQVNVNVSSFNGQPIMIRFRFASDVSTGSTGWFVDDITLDKVPVVLMKSNMFNGSGILQSTVRNVVEIVNACPPQTINTQPVARIICDGTSTTFSVVATGAFAYQWQLSTNVGGTWTDIPGATANTVAVSNVTLAQSGHQYRVVITAPCGSVVTSNAVTLDVTPNPIHQNLTASPNPVCQPGPANLSGTAVGGTLVAGSDAIIASSGVINLGIVDNTTVTSNITMPAFTFNAATNLKVRININHSFVGDLIIRVTSPCGNTVLFDRPGSAGANLGTSNATTPPPGVYIFDINAATIIPETAIAAGFIPQGSYRPSDATAAAHNWAGITFPCSAAGTWTISIQDNAGGDVGTLVDWAIIGPSPVGLYTHSLAGPFTIAQNPSTGGVSNPTGNFTVSNLGAGTQIYNLTSTDSRGCSVTSPISITVNPRPSTIIVPAAISICNGSSTPLTVLDTTKVLTSNVPVIIPDAGNGNPYPGTLTVSGISPFAKVRSVSLTGLTHSAPIDLDIMLQSPNGINVILMSDRGGGPFPDFININYTFQDGFPILGTTFNPSGTYAPTNTAGPDVFPAPGPGSITQITPTIALFNTPALTPNGVWKLFVVDQAAGDEGSITSWSVTFDVPGAQTITYTWSPATGLSSTTGNPVTASPTVNTTYNVSAVSNLGCSSSNQGSSVVTVLALPAITTQPLPATQTICPGFAVSYSVVATGAGLTYQWNKNGTPMVNGGNVSGATSATLTLTGVTLTDAGTYTVVVSGTCALPVTSSGAVLQIGTVPVISAQPPATTIVCERYTTTISVTATALPPIQIYKWQVSTDNITFTDLTNSAPGSSPFYNNVFSSVLTIGNAPLSINGRYYRCVITTNCGFTITSGSSQLTVNATPVVTATPITARVCYSDTLIALSGSPAGGVWSGSGVVPGTSIFLPYNTSVGTFPVKYKVTNTPSGCADSAIINIKVEDCAERIRLLRNDGVLLYPNPNNGQFNIRINSTLYNYLGMKIYTSSGQMVKQQQWSNLPYGRVLPIDIRHLPAAIYMVYVYYDDGVRTSEKTFKVVVPAH